MSPSSEKAMVKDAAVGEGRSRRRRTNRVAGRDAKEWGARERMRESGMDGVRTLVAALQSKRRSTASPLCKRATVRMTRPPLRRCDDLRWHRESGQGWELCITNEDTRQLPSTHNRFHTFTHRPRRQTPRATWARLQTGRSAPLHLGLAARSALYAFCAGVWAAIRCRR